MTTSNGEKLLRFSSKYTLDDFKIIWDELGFEKIQQDERMKNFNELVSGFISGLYEDEQKLCDNVKETISDSQAQLQLLSRELDEELYYVDEKLPLLQKDKLLQNHLNKFKKAKHIRMKDYRHLSEMESTLCSVLAMPTTAMLDMTTLPRKREILELQESVRMLTEEKERRYKKFRCAKQELTTIMEVTECTPETEFERDVICYDNDENFVLSNENLTQISLVLQKFQKKKSDMENEMNELKAKVEGLWNRLKLENEERKAFLKKYEQCTQSSISALRSEIERCEEIKKQNLASYISKLKEELEALWEKCCIQEDDRQFQFLQDGSYTDEMLEAFDNEVERLNKYYASTKEIFQKIEKRKALWERMLTFEKKADDPNRFNNRGGNLLEEERQKKKLLKQLPQLEEDILKAIGQYEDDNDEILLIFGVNFAEFIKKQWDEHNRAKENEKLERQKMRVSAVDQCKTPSKRKIFSTPTSVPSKLSRTNKTNFSSCVSTRTKSRVKTPPTPFQRRNLAVKTTRWVSPRYSNARTPVKKVLIEKNEIPVVVAGNSTLDATSYSQFATELNKNSRYNCRSSVLSKKSIVLGSKLQHSGGVLRKSLSRSAKSSSRRGFEKANTSAHNNKTLRTPVKLTPARGKLGLPFLL